jgi:hypothetical protein
VENHNKKATYYQHISIVFLNPFSQENVNRFVFLLLLIISGLTVLAQYPKENSLTLLKGQILNLEDEMPVVKAIISNQRTRETVTADMEGRFTINALNTDSLEISALGFSKQTISIPSNYSNLNLLIIYASTYRFLIPDVNVNGSYQKPTLTVGKIEVSPYFRNEIMKEKPAEEKASQNQITFLKIPLLGKEQPNHNTRDALKADKQWASVSKIYTAELVRELTGLNATEADHFMMYINSKHLFSKMTTKEDVSFIIFEQFKAYREEGH